MKEVNHFPYNVPNDAAFLGVLSLDGSIKSVEGMLPAVVAAKKEKVKILYLPDSVDLPFHQLEGMELRFVKNIEEVIHSF